MTHLTQAELLAWRDSPSEAGRGRVVAHLAACDQCGAAYAELIRTRAVEDPPSAAPHFRAEDFVARGYSAGTPARARVLPFRRYLMLPLAAAAALALFVWLPARRPAPDPVTPTGTVRGTSLQLLAPSGAVTGPIEFSWSSPVSPDRYALEVKDAAGQRVVYRETRDDRVRADAELEAMLRPGMSYTWTVTALDAAGEVISRSQPASFVRAAARR